MRDNNFHDRSAEFALWSAPLIADRVHGGYEGRLGEENDFSQTLAWLHRRLWRNLLDGEEQQAQQTRRELLAVARLASVRLEEIEAIDAVIVDDLLGVILRHGLSSRDAARHCGLKLVQAAASLGEMRAAA